MHAKVPVQALFHNTQYSSYLHICVICIKLIKFKTFYKLPFPSWPCYEYNIIIIIINIIY